MSVYICLCVLGLEQSFSRVERHSERTDKDTLSYFFLSFLSKFIDVFFPSLLQGILIFEYLKG